MRLQGNRNSLPSGIRDRLQLCPDDRRQEDGCRRRSVDSGVSEVIVPPTGDYAEMLIVSCCVTPIFCHTYIQVLSPAREDLIRRTFEAVKGYPRVIFHMYNATSPCFRSVVFNNDKPQTVDLALRHVKIIRELVAESIANGEGTEWQFEYSPETFSQTEEDFAYDICNQVADCWFEGKDRTKEHPIIFNLPATVEISTPNHYADQVSYCSLYTY